jgi:trimethylamine:corrinoid methyltransferase-like protein
MACALAGADTMLAFGLVDGAQSVSLAKAVLDCDTVGALRRLVKEQEVSAAEALGDDLVEVGIGGHFLARRSTRERSRGGELWRPRTWQRQTFEQYEGTRLVAEAAAQANELLATHEYRRRRRRGARDRRRHRALREVGGRARRPRSVEG